MKTTIYKKLLIFSLLLCSTYCFSQSNLQFNNVITGTGYTTGSPTQTYTVPAGKVWKLERYTLSVLVINGIPIQDFYFNTTNLQGGSGFLLDEKPIWLKEGDSFFLNPGGDNWNPRPWFFSLLEFNK